jgi:proteasome lid subunit RPN8/RPN11
LSWNRESKADSDRGEGDGSPGTDISQIDLSDAEALSFPRSLPSEYRVVISQEAFKLICEHAASDTSVELCGVLAGRLARDDQGPYLLVEQAIRGVATRRTGSQVTFTHETWEQIHGEMESNFPDLRIVGWYHTHPGFGIFLSDMDQFIQDNFFNLPHNIAFVYDPISEERGLFIWKNGQSTRLRRYWLGDQLCYDLSSGSVPAAEPMARKEPADSAERELEQESRARRQEDAPAYSSESSSGVPFSWLLVGAVLLLLAFWLGTMSSRLYAKRADAETEAIQSLIRTGLFRDGLQAQLGTLQRRLSQIHGDLSSLDTDPTTKVKVADAASLREIQKSISETHTELNRIIRAYSEADRLATRMKMVSQLPQEVNLLKTENLTLRITLAQSLRLQANQLLDTLTDEEKLRYAKDLAAFADHLAPQTIPQSIRRDQPLAAPAPEKKERRQ